MNFVDVFMSSSNLAITSDTRRLVNCIGTPTRGGIIIVIGTYCMLRANYDGLAWFGEIF